MKTEPLVVVVALVAEQAEILAVVLAAAQEVVSELVVDKQALGCLPEKGFVEQIYLQPCWVYTFVIRHRWNLVLKAR